MNVKKFFKENRNGFIFSSLTIIFGYPLLHIFQNKTLPSLYQIGLSVPIAFLGTLIFMFIFGFIMEAKD